MKRVSGFGIGISNADYKSKSRIEVRLIFLHPDFLMEHVNRFVSIRLGVFSPVNILIYLHL